MNVAVLGQNSLFRAGLVTLLPTLGFSPIAEAATLTELKELTTGEGGFEILLVHLSGETTDGAQWMREIRASLLL